MNPDDIIQERGREWLKAERPTDPIFGRLWDNANRAMAQSRENSADSSVESVESKTADPADAPANLNPESELSPLTVQRSLPLEARLRSAARDLKNFDSHGSFDSFPIQAQNEFPTSLTRLPIFRPSQRRKQQSIQDLDNAVPFDTPYGAGRRLGPPLTIRDEDTLIALMRLRDRALTGPESSLPENVRDIYQSKSGTTEVHRVVCTVDQINTELGLSDSGTNFKNTMDSVKRLNASKIELDKIMADGSRVGGAFDLIKVQWRVYERHGLVDVIFPPIMAHWLKHSYTYIDWNVRRELTALGKAVHRYLSGQRHDFAIDLRKLSVTIGFDGRQEHMKGKFTSACNELVSVGWLQSFEITGSGRSKPFVLKVVRAKKST